MKQSYYFNRPQRPLRCVRSSEFPSVQPGLAVTPSDMLNLAEHGVAVSSQNNAMFNDGEVNPSWVIQAERSRGVDPADLWELQGDVRRKALAAYRADVAKYGNTSD